MRKFMSILTFIKKKKNLEILFLFLSYAWSNRTFIDDILAAKNIQNGLPRRRVQQIHSKQCWWKLNLVPCFPLRSIFSPSAQRNLDLGFDLLTSPHTVARTHNTDAFSGVVIKRIVTEIETKHADRKYIGRKNLLWWGVGTYTFLSFLNPTAENKGNHLRYSYGTRTIGLSYT